MLDFRNPNPVLELSTLKQLSTGSLGGNVCKFKIRHSQQDTNLQVFLQETLNRAVEA